MQWDGSEGNGLRAKSLNSLNSTLINNGETTRMVRRTRGVCVATCIVSLLLFTYLPPGDRGVYETGLTYLPLLHLTALAYLSRNKTKTLPARAAAARASAAAA